MYTYVRVHIYFIIHIYNKPIFQNKKTSNSKFRRVAPLGGRGTRTGERDTTREMEAIVNVLMFGLGPEVPIVLSESTYIH